jgi:transcriptional regulator with XRE-family HTH domain
VTPEQSRAARAWLNWSQSDLADRANVSLAAVVNFETGRRTSHRATLTAMRRALEQGGVRFLFIDELAVGIIRADVEWRFHRSESEVTWADVEAVKLPFIVNGRRLYQNSKRALIIKPIIALLKKKKWAQQRQIFETLRELKIDITRPTLSVILAEAKGLFYSCRRENGDVVGWSMNNCCDLDEQCNNKKIVHHQLNEDEFVLHDKHETGSPLEVRLANRNSNRRSSVRKRS